MVAAIVAVALRAIIASIVLGGALALIVFVATRVLALSAATRHALWTTALFAIAAMPLAGIGFSLARATTAPEPSAVTHAHVSVSVSHEAASRLRIPVHHPSVPSATSAGANLPRIALPRLTPVLALGLVAAWALGALIGLIGLIASVWRVRGLKRRSSPLDAALSDELPWLTEVGPGREIYLRLSYETETPVAIGFRRPVILIPTELATADGLAAIEPLVLHEHAHLRRYDDWTNLAQRVIERLFWFNPLVWVIGRRIALEREIASDDAVVERTGAPADYASSLWRLAREMRMPEHAVVAPGALLTRKQISVRIEQLLDANRARLHRSPATALGVATAALLAVAFVATSSPAVELPAPPHPPVLAQATPAPPTPPARPRRIVVVTIPSPLAAPTVAAPRVVVPPNVPSPRGLDESIQQMVHDALASAGIAAQTAGDVPARRVDGVRASRAMIASCVGCSLRNADLHGLDLHGIAINGDDLRNVNLRGANLSGAHITGTSLANADLTGADLRNAELSGVTLHNAKLDDALLEGTRFVGTTLRDVSLRGTSLRSVLASCVGCDFKQLDLHGQDLHGLSLNGVDLNGADLHDANLSGTRMTGVDLNGANLRGADLTNTHFEGCDLHSADLHNARTEGMTLTSTTTE